MHDRCPTCGKSIGTTMETHPDRSGLIELLSGSTRPALRIALTLALLVLLTLAIVATKAVFR